MLDFSKFLLVEAETSLRGSLSGADSYKTISHVLRYVLPFVDKEKAASIVNSLGKHVSNPQKALSDHSQIDVAKQRDYTHILAKDHGDLKSGTPISVKGVSVQDNKVLVNTEKHGEIPLSKLGKPPELAKQRVAKKAWGLEDILAGNLGGKPAGSSKVFHDFAYPPQGGDVKTKKVKGSAKTVSKTEPTEEEILAKGEAKGHNGVMGNAKIAWGKEKGWAISHSDPELAKHMSKAHVNGVPLTEYLNKNHPNGVIDKGFRAAAPVGMSKTYLNSIGSNVLHIHDLDKDVGTTFTIGDELKGKTKLGHMDENTINELDGIIDVAKTQNGKTLAFHRPNQINMKKRAQMSANDPNNHRSLINTDHAKEFMSNLDLTRKQNSRTLDHKATFADKDFYSDDEKRHIQGLA